MLGGGGACALQNIHTRMHAYIYTHIYPCGCISKFKAIMNGRPFIRNQNHLSKSERSKRGKFLAKVFQTQRGTLIFLDTQTWTQHLLCHPIIFSDNPQKYPHFHHTPKSIHFF